jgi:hypothetical protein
MGNQIIAEFAEQLRLSTLGTTLSSRSNSAPPAMVNIESFPGVGRAFVVFNGATVAIDANCPIFRSRNVTNVQYKGPGDYKINFTTAFPNEHVITTGSLAATTTANANNFYVKYAGLGGENPSISAVRIQTLLTSLSTTSAVDCHRASLMFFAA